VGLFFALKVVLLDDCLADFILGELGRFWLGLLGGGFGWVGRRGEWYLDKVG
jgi:hypothetical protein